MAEAPKETNKIHFGSLEEELLVEQTVEENKIKGVSFDVLEKKPPVATVSSLSTSSNVQPTELQAVYLQELGLREREKQLVIPTDSITVKKYLRIIGEPIILFGEGPYEQRERLRRLLATNSAFYKKLLEGSFQILKGESIDESTPSQIPDNEEFFVPGSDILLDWRRWLVDFSLNSSKERLSREKLYKSQTPTVVKEARAKIYNNISTIKLVASQVGGNRPLSACAASKDGNLIACGDLGGQCRVWSTVDSFSCIRELEAENAHHSRIGSIIFNPMDDQIVASCDLDGKIALWKLSIPQPIGLLKGHELRVAKLAFHPSGRLLASACYDHTWRLWDVERQIELQFQEGHSRPVYSISFHPDGALVATGGLDTHGRVWDLRSGRAIWTLQGHTGGILDVSFNPLRPLIATGSEDATVCIWDLRKLQPSYILPAHSSLITVSKYSSNGELLLTAGYDGNVRVWGAIDHKIITTFNEHEGKVMDACFINNSLDKEEGILTASHDRTFKIWKL